MTTVETNPTDKAATVAAQGAHVAPEKAPAKKAASQKISTNDARATSEWCDPIPAHSMLPAIIHPRFSPKFPHFSLDPHVT
jgi:hypothetical protein